MVAVDDNRKPVAVRPLVPATVEQKRRSAEAKLRKHLRAETRERFNAARMKDGEAVDD